MLETLSTNTEESSEFLKPFTSSIISLAKPSKHECVICTAPALYKCPKCSTRTCSAKCSKTHKEDQKCDGQSSIRPRKKSWKPIFGTSQFQENKTGIEDQQFLHKLGNAIRANIGGGEKEVAEQNDEMQKTKTISTANSIDHGLRQFNQLSQPERFLLQNAQFRRIWLRLDEPKNSSPNKSHHEPFSDTIFWTCTVKFVYSSHQTKLAIDQESKDDEKETNLAISFPLVDYGMDDEEDVEEGGEEMEEEESKTTNDSNEKITTKEIGELEEGEDEEEDEEEEDGELEMEEKQQKHSELKWLNYTVHNIPESIRLITLLRQFLRPKPYGSVISRSELDLPQLDPFIRAFESSKPNEMDLMKDGLDKLSFFMEVELDTGTTDEREMRYYPVDPERTILENLRNRFVIDHPKFVVVLRRANEFGELELPMMGEAEQKLLQAEREQQIGGEGGNGFKDRPKWQQQKKGGGRGEGGDRLNHRKRGGNAGKRGGGGTKMMNGQFQQQPMMPNPHMQMPVPLPPPPNGHPPAYFYHPYVVNPSTNPLPYHHMPHPQQFGQQHFAGGGWQQPPNRSFMPRNNQWRGGGRN